MVVAYSWSHFPVYPPFEGLGCFRHITEGFLRAITAVHENKKHYGNPFLAGFLLLSAVDMPPPEWESVTKKGLAGFAAGFGVFLLALLYSEPGFIVILDHANLLFHEAGHPLVGLFSARLEPYGGTMGQLAFPIVLLVACWRKGQVFGVAASGIWFFENWFNIARYMADARALELPLVGGGDHDWNTILSRWGLLQWDVQLAACLRIFAWLGLAATCGWLGWRAWQGRREMPERLALGAG